MSNPSVVSPKSFEKSTAFFHSTTLRAGFRHTTPKVKNSWGHVDHPSDEDLSPGPRFAQYDSNSIAANYKERTLVFGHTTEG
jgi:hypothetical protein